MNETSRTIVVLGATGQQGGSVAAALRAEDWSVRAIVRDPSSPGARALAATGVEVVPGDLGDPQSLRAAFRGAHGVFSVQPSSGQAGAGLRDADEVRFGTSVADIAQQSGVSHLVYSSTTVAAGSVPTGVPHFDSKIMIEQHVRSLDRPSTIIQPAGFMETLMLPGMGLDQGRLTYLMRPDQAMQFIAVRDIGRVTAAIFAAPEEYTGRTLQIVGDALTGNDLAEKVSHAAGQRIVYSRLPASVLEQSEMLRKTVALLDTGRFTGKADQAVLRQEFPFLLRFGDWLAGPGASLLEDALRTVGARVALR
jgi:uncharacterized protein YbjT (DUF2867 family)